MPPSSDDDYDVQTISFFQANNATPPSSTGGYANKMTIQLPQSMNLQDSEVALASLFCYYSWFNITAALNNNTLSYTLPTGTGWGTTYPVFTDSSNQNVIGDGLYSITDLNNALAFTFQYNGHYFIDANGNNVYPISLSVNQTGYNVTITLTQLYRTLPTGWSVPTSALGPSPFTATGSTVNNFSVNTVARLNIPNTGNVAGVFLPGLSSMSKILGISPGSYPSVSDPSTVLSSQFQYKGNYPPQVSPVDSVNVCCNLVNASSLSAVAASLIYNFAPSSTSGTLIQQIPAHFMWLPVTPGLYNQVSLSLQTSAFTPLQIIDPAVSATLLIRTKRLPSRKQQIVQQAISQPVIETHPALTAQSSLSIYHSKRPRAQ